MNFPRIIVLTFIVIGLVFSTAIAMKHLPEERGKALFNDTKFAGATSGKSCNSCHPAGKGLGKAGDKMTFKIMGATQNSLAEAVNFCIVNAIKGKAIDEKSGQMKDVVAYIRSLKKKAPGN
jgi:cytochrome c